MREADISQTDSGQTDLIQADFTQAADLTIAYSPTRVPAKIP